MTIYRDALSQYGLRTVETFLPQTMADDRDKSGRVEPVFAVGESPAPEQTHTECFKKCFVHRSAVIRVTAAADADGKTLGGISHERSKRFALLCVIAEIRITVAEV